jgi:hypothetical protein
MAAMAEKGSRGWLQAAGAVFWSFFGVRKRAHYDADASKLTPAQVIVAGVIGAVLFVLTLVAVVLWVTAG